MFLICDWDCILAIIIKRSFGNRLLYAAYLTRHHEKSSCRSYELCDLRTDHLNDVGRHEPFWLRCVHMSKFYGNAAPSKCRTWCVFL